jgi:hypothetical protein
MWIIDKLYGFESEPNARMKMGLAAEDAAHYGLSKQINDENTITKYAKTKYLEYSIDEEIDGLAKSGDDEYEWSGKIANTFVKELKQYGDVISYQKEADVPGDKYGLKFNIVAKTDFEFEHFIVDTKATAKVWRYAANASEKKQGKKGRINHNYHPKSDHLRQQFLYRELFGKDCLLLYASPWDNHTSDLGDHVGYLEQLINAFKSIEHILNIANTKEDVVRMYPLTFDNWRWRYTPGAEEFARKIWSKAFK